MVTPEAFEQWAYNTFKRYEPVPSYIVVFEGETGVSYAKPDMIYRVFEPVFQPADSMEDVTLASLEEHVSVVNEQEQPSQWERNFLAAESNRSRLAYWEREGFFQNQPEFSLPSYTDELVNHLEQPLPRYLSE